MPHYERAPITEALIDIRVEPSQIRFEDLQGLGTHLDDYPVQETRNFEAVTIQFGTGIAPTREQKPWSIVFRNKDNNQVAQFRVDGFTFSRLEPYQDWEHLRDEAKRLWDIYCRATEPRKILRVAVRYINVLNLPGEKVEPEEYLNIFPVVPQNLPAGLRDFGPFSMRLPFHQSDLHGILMMNQGNTPMSKPGCIAIVLDLDLYVDNPPVTSEQELWGFLEKLRERKNLYFEASITDKTRELIS
jgi:uncharacterized protein (TIGR04255 family)